MTVLDNRQPNASKIVPPEVYESVKKFDVPEYTCYRKLKNIPRLKRTPETGKEIMRYYADIFQLTANNACRSVLSCSCIARDARQPKYRRSWSQPASMVTSAVTGRLFPQSRSP